MQIRQLEHGISGLAVKHTATTSAQLMDGHFCIKLPLKDDKVKMPCNRGIAEQRLNSLKRKFSRTTDFFQEYKAFMNNILEKGCLKSVATEDQAAALVKELMTLCASGGFYFTKWVSNRRVLLGSIPDHKRAAEVKDLDLEHDELPVERALGVQWCTSTDSFRFKINLSDKPCIRRGILSVVSSVYDPMGFLAPLLLPVKLILKDPCKEKKGWDEEIPEKPRRTWKKWLTDLDKLSELSVNRCFKPTAFGPTKAAQIHHFSDASQDGYGVVSYLLSKNDQGEKHVSFLMGKSRVAPLKQITIPRMELTAAMIAVKMDRMVRKELEVPLMESAFWTDSTTVLKNIENDALR